MSRCRLPVLLAVLGLATFAFAQNEKKKPDPKAVDVRFSDGSTVRMTVLEESIDVETRYGKLTVPTSEIRRIEFAFRLPEETTRKIEAAVRDLGHEIHARRAAASKELEELGVVAYPALLAAAKSADAEVARRAAEVIQQTKEKVPAEALRFPTQDTIQTTEFPINGRILTTSLRAKTAYFGDVQLRIADMRQMRWLAGGGDTMFALEAARYANPNSWMETEVNVSALSPVVITASGQVDLWPQSPGQYMTGPNGYNRGQPAPNVPGSVLGKVGANGRVFVIGERYEGTPGEDGPLHLHIVPSPWNNASSGAYTIKVVSKP